MIIHHSTLTRARLIAALSLSAILFQPSAAAATFARHNAQRRSKSARPSSPKRQQTAPAEAAESAGLKTYALRLRPGQDLRVELERFAKAKGLRAGLILTAVGSLRKASLRLANQSDATSYDDKFEIVSLVGTLSPDGAHLHLSVSDGAGKTIGGHLVEGCTIYTTAEIVIGELKGLRFTREQDAQTGYKELRIRRP
jgi:predicted DNA-binding protein with PD1-like motif